MSSQSLRVGTWNILHGVDLTTGLAAATNKLGKAAQLLNCDILGIQEVDLGQPRSHGVDQTATIADALGARDFRFEASLAGTPGEQWIAHHDDWEGPRYGIGLVSRLPVRRWHRLDLAPAKWGMPLLVPTPRGPRLGYVPDEPRVAVAAECEGVTVANVHLSFVPGRNISQLKQVIRWLSALPGPRILLGDFNLPGSLASRTTKWRDLAKRATYPAWKPRVQFDHILSDSIHEVISVDQPATGISDHLPLVITTK